jgi:hypothetical protein
VDIDDLKNPEYRKGRRKPAQIETPAPPPRRPAPGKGARRAHFAAQVARAAFNRFYWSDQLRRRMDQELEQSRRRRREAAEHKRQRQRNGGGK